MANGFTIVTNRDNTFFTNNKMTVGSGIPTSGSYKIGDIVISDSQANGVFGWVCTQAGNPGRWEVIGSGAGGGNSVLVEYSNIVEFTDARTSIDIGIPEYNKETDSLEVHYNGLLLAQDVHYSINEAGTAITNLNGSWNANTDDTQAMIFVVRKSTAGLNVIPMRNVVDINNATMEVDPGIKINPSTDIVSVHLNGVLLMEGIDYKIENGKIIKVEQDEAWNPYNVVGQKMFIDVLRNKGRLNEPDMGSISKEHLTSELAGEINNNTNSINSLTEIANSHTNLINNLTTQIENVDFSEVEAKINVNTASIGDKTQLQTTTKDNLVAAINELFQNANNGKELIANAIGEPLVSTDTFSAMSNDINGLLSTFKTNMMNSGVMVEGTDKFKQLIDKIKGLTEGEGNRGIQYATGNSSINVPVENKYTENLNFKPNILVLYTNSGFILYNEFNSSDSYNTVFYSGYVYNWTFAETGNYVNESGFSFGRLNDDAEYTWYAIGVGEEDTTLRDSLASILEEEGVSVTPEDDMASLITKVDEEFDRQVVPTGDAVASDVAKGKTFINNTGEVITGTVTVNKYLFENGGDESLYTADRSVINYGNADLTHENGYLKFYCSGSSYQTNTIYFTLNEEIDLTDRTAVWFDLSISGNTAYSYFSFGVYEGTGTFNEDTTLAEGYYTEYEGSVKAPFYRAKYRIDVSACTGVHKIGIYLGAYGSYSSYLYLYNIELE